MINRESFLERWSRRKRAAPNTAKADTAASAPASAARQDGSETPSGKGAEVPFDLSKLPPLETINAETDIRGYLAPGVPAELTRAALRRAWAADPKIRDFVGLSENAWDFNAPEGVLGFGPLQMTDELRRQIVRMVGGSTIDEPPQEVSRTPERAENSIETVENSSSDVRAETAASQPGEQPDAAIAPKRHGGAVPS